MTRDQAWDVVDRLWILCFKTWGFWFLCIIVGGSIGGIASEVIVALGFLAIFYFMARVAMAAPGIMRATKRTAR